MNRDYKYVAILTRWHKIILITGAIVLYAVCYYLFKSTMVNDAYPFVATIIAVVAVIAFYLLIRAAIKKGYRNINSILSHDCDPQRFVRVYRNMIKRYSHTKRQPDLSAQKLNLSAGLVAAGEYLAALDVLKGVSNSALKVMYLQNKCSALIGLGEFSKAQQSLDECARLIPTIKYRNDAARKTEEARLEFMQHVLNAAQGNYIDSLNVFKGAFENSYTNSGRASAKFYLGEAYLHDGDLTSAKEAFEYVVQVGNKLYVAKQARARLQDL